jgi:hypothetical protein
MGIGIWSMHFVGMLGFSLPVPVSYYWPTVLLFFILAVLAATLALYEVSRERMGGAQLLRSKMATSAATKPPGTRLVLVNCVLASVRSASPFRRRTAAGIGRTM